MKIGMRTRLLTATALAATASLSPHAAHAQITTGQTDGAPPPAQAPNSQKPSDAVAPEDILREIVVNGGRRQLAGGLMIVQRQPETTNSISAEAIAQKMGIAGPFQLVASLPGVSTGQSDPYQMNIRHALFLRGLPMNKIGWVVDGVNALDRGYGNPYSETWADNENIAGLTILPGSTRIVDPVHTAVGGEFSMTIRDPSDVAGGKVSYSHGSFDGRRAFAGFDTGEIGDTGLKAFATFSYTQAGTFALPKDALSKRFHSDVKFSKDWGEAGTSTLWFGYNDSDVARSQPFTLAQFATAKQQNNYGQFNYAFAWNPTGTSNTYWKYAVWTRENLLVAWNNDLNLSDKLSLKITPYYQWIKSNSPGGSTVNPASVYTGTQQQTVSTAGLFLLPNGTIPVKSFAVQHQHVYGVNSIAKYDLSSTNSLQLGWWYDHFKLEQLNGFSPVSAGGDAPDWGKNPLISTTGQVISGAHYALRTNIHAFSIQDSQSFLDDKLRIEAGVKYFVYRMSGTNLLPGPQSAMKYKFEKLLPRATISYDISDRMQVYGNVISEIRAGAPSSTYPNTYNTSNGTISQLGNLTGKPERSLGEELGFRYHDHFVTADIALYNKKLKDNTVTSQAFLNGAGVTSTLSAGGLKMRGITAELALGPIEGFSPYVNGQYLWTQTDTNLQVVSNLNGSQILDYLPTKGKNGVQAPKYTATLGINYNKGPIFGNVLVKYTGSQYSTFMNDEKFGGYTTMDVGIGYRLPEGSLGKDPVIRISATNIGNEPYLSTYASVRTNAKPTTGLNGGTVTGGPASYWLGSPRAIMGTFSTSF